MIYIYIYQNPSLGCRSWCPCSTSLNVLHTHIYIYMYTIYMHKNISMYIAMPVAMPICPNVLKAELVPAKQPIYIYVYTTFNDSMQYSLSSGIVCTR